MITEDYVSFETAKLLKKKGFDEALWASYDIDGYFDNDHALFTNKTECDGFECVAPTQQMAMKWLREVHKIGVFPATYTIKTELEGEYYTYGTAIVNLITHDLMNLDYLARDTYKDAVEAAIKYCLENLI